MKFVCRPWISPVLAATVIGLAAPSTALADEDSKLALTLPFQRLAVGATLGGMGVGAGTLSLGFDPYSQVQFEVAARLATGTMERQDDAGFPDYNVDCDGSEDVYPCAANAAMLSMGIILGKHNTWEGINPAVAVRTGMSTLGEVYTSVGPYVEGGLNENHTLTWTAEASLGYWFREPHRAPSDLLGLAWNGIHEGPLDSLSQHFLLSIRLGIQFYPIR